MRGYDVVMLTGTDEHGQKVERAAKEAGVKPQAYADRISNEYRSLWAELDIYPDRFIRTTEPQHVPAVHRLMRQAKANGYVYKGFYEGNYCIYDEMYVDEPLPGGLCPECKRVTEHVREENYYFKLSAFQDRLLKLYEEQPEWIQPESRRNEVLAFVRGPLRDLSVSRTTIKWGVPWPDDDKHVFYVWYDALTSYMTGVGYGDDELQWERYWPADLHLVGKEILRFHAVYWPAFLMAANEPLPKKIFAHGWWHVRGRKNVQVPRQHAVPPAHRPHPGNRCAAIFPAARNGVRPGREFQPRRAAHSLQRRPRQRPGKPSQPHRNHDREIFRRLRPSTRRRAVSAGR